MHDWLIQAVVTRKTADNYQVTEQIPTFILPGRMLGIVDDAHALKIVDSMFHGTVCAVATEYKDSEHAFQEYQRTRYPSWID